MNLFWFCVLPKNTTKTAQYAAVAAKTSCLRALVKIEQQAANVRVKKNITRIWCNPLFCTTQRTETGTKRSTVARIVMIM